MKTNKVLAGSAIVVFIAAIGLFVYLLNISKAFSYLSSDSKACINCHVMNTQYATWQHSSHAAVAGCADCHLPQNGFISKYIAKARDGFNHAAAFTFNTYDNAIKISDDGAARVQNNCILCHASIASVIVTNSDINHRYNDKSVKTGRRCFDCHKEVPHGKVRGLSTTPYNLGVQYVK
ncbi:MAG: cytochrome c nitrite reductase small subunit [Campylobacteraceae bacterium]|nr:cytochrome c nitrite reductase small subunit [Campylobacteraceae bacterium]